MIPIDEYTRQIREIFGEYPANSGGCRKFAKHLKSVFGGELYYNGEHFLLRKEDIYYDLRGEYQQHEIVLALYEGELKKYPISDFIHESEFGSFHIARSFGEDGHKFLDL